ncbi:hypothetical protein FHS51_001867 [Sphingobium wenxiniae]|uniref:hypothetical protein n=1 Tax=Sphingobium TaxID=165695 RepID=UPI0004146EE7|nr:MULTISPECIES: hypothetical protein [Sphingobium]MBB6191639.1 hypothetical protein [Sphingobium wenxiniae]WRD76526.1 hypothetical protein QQ987_17580 [Sphingobium baderi]
MLHRPVLKEIMCVCCIGMAGHYAGPEDHPRRIARGRVQRGMENMPHAASTCSTIGSRGKARRWIQKISQKGWPDMASLSGKRMGSSQCAMGQRLPEIF